MFEIARHWEQLFTVIQASGDGKREESAEVVKQNVLTVARQLKEAFERNDKKISELKVHEASEEKEVMEDHNNAVL